MSYQVQAIPAKAITAGDNDRKTFAGLEDLAASIRAGGIDQPPTVRPVGDGRYELVMGERRTRAMRDVLGWDAIPCIVRELDDSEASAAMLRENTARADLDPVEEARAYAKRTANGLSISELASQAGRSEATVRARLALLALTEASLHLVSRREIPLGHAVMMAGLDSNRQVLALKAYHAERLDAPAFGGLCDRLKLEQGSESIFDASTFMRAEEYAAEAKAQAAKPDPQAEIGRLRAQLASLEAQSEPLLGVQEVAELLGVQTRTVHMWRHRDILPERDATVSGLPAWRQGTITAWAEDTGRMGRQVPG